MGTKESLARYRGRLDIATGCGVQAGKVMSFPDAVRNGWSSFKEDFFLGGMAGKRRFLRRLTTYLGDMQSALHQRWTPDEGNQPPAAYRRDLLWQLTAADRGTPGAMPVRTSPVKTVALLTNQVLDWSTLQPTYGGGERVCLTLASLLREQGIAVTIYQGAQQPFRSVCDGFDVVGLASRQRYSEFDHGISEAFYERSHGYDAVIYNLPELASAQRMRSDAILLCHGVWFDHRNYQNLSIRSEEWFRHLYRAFAHPGLVVSVDTNSINVVRALWPELAAKMVFLPNFADCQRFYPDPSRVEKRSPQELTILFPRRSHINRGSRILGDILLRIPYPCRFQWIGEGDGPDNQIIARLCEKDSRLQFLKASFDEMPAYYRAADICVIPTIACEGTSLSCIEGMASGCAMVSTHIGGLSDIIQSGINGLLASPTAESIAGAVNHLIEHHEERTRLQLAARQSALHFDVSRWRERWLAILSHHGWIASCPSEPSLFWL